MNHVETRRVPLWIHAINQIIRLLLRAGIPLGLMTMLTVQGRKTGQPRTTPVGLFKHEGNRYLFSTFGESNWVRNIRVAGEAILSRGHHSEKIAVVELTAAEAAPVLKGAFVPYLASPFTREMLRSLYGVTRNASLSDYLDVAKSHPVFRLG